MRGELRRSSSSGDFAKLKGIMNQPGGGKAFGFWICTALVIGNMIGSGVFLLPSSLASFGWNATFGWLLTIAGTMALAFVLAKLARAFPHEGGPYAYVQAASDQRSVLRQLGPIGFQR